MYSLLSRFEDQVKVHHACVAGTETTLRDDYCSVGIQPGHVTKLNCMFFSVVLIRKKNDFFLVLG